MCLREPQKEAGDAERERARTGLERVMHEHSDCEAFLLMWGISIDVRQHPTEKQIHVKSKAQMIQSMCLRLLRSAYTHFRQKAFLISLDRMSSAEHKTNHGNNWTNFYHDSLRLFGSSTQLVEIFLLYIRKRKEYKTSCFGSLGFKKSCCWHCCFMFWHLYFVSFLP